MPRSINREKLEKQAQAIMDSGVFASAADNTKEMRKGSSMLRAKIGSERAKKEAPYLLRADPKACGGSVKRASGGRVKRGTFSPY